MPSVVPDGGELDSSAHAIGSTLLVELFNAPSSTLGVEATFLSMTSPGGSALWGSTESTSALVPSVFSVPDELDNSTGNSAGTTEEGSELFEGEYNLDVKSP